MSMPYKRPIFNLLHTQEAVFLLYLDVLKVNHIVKMQIFAHRPYNCLVSFYIFDSQNRHLNAVLDI